MKPQSPFCRIIAVVFLFVVLLSTTINGHKIQQYEGKPTYHDFSPQFFASSKNSHGHSSEEVDGCVGPKNSVGILMDKTASAAVTYSGFFPQGKCQCAQKHHGLTKQFLPAVSGAGSYIANWMSVYLPPSNGGSCNFCGCNQKTGECYVGKGLTGLYLSPFCDSKESCASYILLSCDSSVLNSEDNGLMSAKNPSKAILSCAKNNLVSWQVGAGNGLPSITALSCNGCGAIKYKKSKSNQCFGRFKKTQTTCSGGCCNPKGTVGLIVESVVELQMRAISAVGVQQQLYDGICTCSPNNLFKVFNPSQQANALKIVDIYNPILFVNPTTAGGCPNFCACDSDKTCYTAQAGVLSVLIVPNCDSNGNCANYMDIKCATAQSASTTVGLAKSTTPSATFYSCAASKNGAKVVGPSSQYPKIVSVGCTGCAALQALSTCGGPYAPNFPYKK